MEPMEKLYALYEAHLNRLASDVDRLNQEWPDLEYGPSRVRRMNRSEFAEYLLNGRETETKRCFLRRILQGNEHLSGLLPLPLKTLAERAA
jgi:hypothetical protein